MGSGRLALSFDDGAGRRREPSPFRDRLARSAPEPPPAVLLSSLREGERAVVVEVRASAEGRADRLLALGVTPGASVTVLQTFPGVVFLCDQTELAVERRVAQAIVVRTEEIRR
jgi:Fe2+ transport system protein FeoA